MFLVCCFCFIWNIFCSYVRHALSILLLGKCPHCKFIYLFFSSCFLFTLLLQNKEDWSQDLIGWIKKTKKHYDSTLVLVIHPTRKQIICLYRYLISWLIIICSYPVCYGCRIATSIGWPEGLVHSVILRQTSIVWNTKQPVWSYEQTHGVILVPVVQSVD